MAISKPRHRLFARKLKDLRPLAKAVREELKAGRWPELAHGDFHIMLGAIEAGNPELAKQVERLSRHDRGRLHQLLNPPFMPTFYQEGGRGWRLFCIAVFIGFAALMLEAIPFLVSLAINQGR